ncbi:related to HOL1 protein [Phialocephala subalpina]|uniref:Related to HOL1 protein n=1 Tax=Phialocephala subalpina TaxID=576137 RepID=A0A1L7XB05_9HELO|nr:related to HOL1 protein [Phialocephala subalpina]
MSSPSPKVSAEDIRDEKDTTNIEETPPSPIADLKMHHDGSTILVPQPSSDPNDPLNWSVMKKHVFLFVIAVTAFLPDYGSSTGAITNLVQPVTFGVPETIVNHSLVGNLFMLGAGGIFVVALSAYFGRLPVLFWFSIFAFLTAAWSAAATTLESFEGARILHGFFSTVAQAGGLMFIKDIFFAHEHPRKINIWSCFIVVSPYLGPFVASFITWKSTWPWAYWVLTILWAVALILIVGIMDETYYDRKIPQGQQPRRKSRLLRLIGVEQWHSRHQRNTFPQAMSRPAIAITKIPVILVTLYYVFTFGWVIGLNATTGVFLHELYHFNSEASALYFFAPMVATVLGEITGHFVFDLSARIYRKRNNGSMEPEARLLPLWFATPLMVLGIVLLGFTLENHWHYMVMAVTWGLFVYGIIICTTGINAYLLDAYPEASGEVAAWINFGRTVGGFIITYYEIPWITAMGTRSALGIQASIVAAAFGFIVVLQFWGKRLREFSGSVKFATD